MNSLPLFDASESLRRDQGMGYLKAITLIQPWATLVMLGLKGYETRSWGTAYRGQLVIHAGKKLDKEALEDFIEESILEETQEIPLGVALGTVDLIDCLPTETVSLIISVTEDLCGDFSPGRFAWKMVNPVPFQKPIPYRGSLGLWDFPERLAFPEVHQ